jgi:hypothetical protein
LDAVESDRKNPDGHKTPGDEGPRQKSIALQKRRRKLEVSRPSRQSLEGLRLGALLRQMEALQALQGLQELNPATEGHRFKISDDPEERERQGQWLKFKVDWLEALLESTLSDLERLEAFRGGEEGMPSSPK